MQARKQILGKHPFREAGMSNERYETILLCEISLNGLEERMNLSVLQVWKSRG